MPPDAPAFVYDRSRRFEAMMPLSPEMERGLRGDLKGYFQVKVTGKTIKILGRLKDQTW